MRKILVVARWEYLERVKSKTFLIGLFLTPLIMIAMIILPSILVSHEDETTRVIGVVDLTGEIAQEFAKRMQEDYTLSNGEPNYVIRIVRDGANPMLTADALVLEGEIDGYCVIHGTAVGDSALEYRSKNTGDLRLNGRMEETVRTILVNRRLSSLGLDVSLIKELTARSRLRTVKLSESGEARETEFAGAFFRSYAVLMMFFFAILTSGQLLVRSVVEEKSNRIVELLVSSCSSTELMGGKILGLSALALTQMALWGLVVIGATTQTSVEPFTIGQVLLLLLYFVLGYLFYAAIFVGVGSPVTTEQEAQQLTSYLVLIIVIPVVVALPALQNPESTWLRVMSFIPPLIPTTMALRVTIADPPMEETLATLFLLLVSTVLGIWLAGRIFRVAILATGKRPSLRELFTWIRSG